MSTDRDSAVAAAVERAREEYEERVSYAERIGASALPSMDSYNVTRTARVIRDYVRGAMIPLVIRRLYNIAMGVERFDVPTMMGNVVSVPASASVQTKALAELVKLGVPQQVGLVDDDGNALPGVIALPPLDLDAARLHTGTPAHLPFALPGQPVPDTPAPAPHDTTSAGVALELVEEHEVVSVTHTDAPPPAVTEPPPPAPAVASALERARQRRAGHGAAAKRSGTRDG